MAKVFPVESLLEDTEDLLEEEESFVEKKPSKKEREKIFVKRNKKKFVEDWID